VGGVPLKLSVPMFAPIENEPKLPTVNLAVFWLVNTGTFRTVIGYK
jgi:hypothetical protein